MDRCPQCGSTDLATIPGPHPGGHHAKLVCLACIPGKGRWVRWLSRPRPPTSADVFRRAAELAPAIDAPLPALEGTPRQVAYAGRIRAAMLGRLSGQLSPDAFRAMRGIAWASWWIANDARAAEDLRWPVEWFGPPASGEEA